MRGAKFSDQEGPQLYRFLDAGNTEACRTLGEPASKKRRCTKSRDAGQRLGGERYGDFSLASHPNGLVEAQACGDALGMPGCGSGQGSERSVSGGA